MLFSEEVGTGRRQYFYLYLLLTLGGHVKNGLTFSVLCKTPEIRLKGIVHFT